MTVKKKVQTISIKSDKMNQMNLVPELKRVRELIKTLPTEEELAMTEQAAAPKTTDPKPAVKKAVKKVTKKAAPKKAAAKSVKKVTKKAETNGNQVTLAELCKSMKIEPVLARRRLRAASIARGEGRWAWEKDSAALNKVKAALNPPQAAK